MKFLQCFMGALILITSSSAISMAAPEDERIVVNIREDGTFTNEELEELEDVEALKIYIARRAAFVEVQGLEPVMHLRGSKEAVFKHNRAAVRAAAEVGVDRVIFEAIPPRDDQAVPEPDAQPNGLQRFFGIPEPPPLGDGFIEPRDFDLNLALPAPAGPADVDAVIDPLIITIKGNGQILANDKLMDMDPNVRDLPLLTEVLRLYKDGVDAIGEKPRVQIFAEDEAAHQRVIDVLNALAGVKINSVTFTDLSDEKK